MKEYMYYIICEGIYIYNACVFIFTHVRVYTKDTKEMLSTCFRIVVMSGGEIKMLSKIDTKILGFKYIDQLYFFY